MRNSPGAIDEQVFDAVEGSSDVGRSPRSPPRAPGPRLGKDKEAYVLRPALRGRTVQCHISRDKRGELKDLFPFYYLYLEAADGRKVRSGSLGSKPHLPGASPAPF